MSARTFLLGMNAKAYQGAAGAALSALSEMSNVKDVSLNLEAGEADVTTRANNGWRANAATLRECAAEFEMLWKPGDLIFQAVKKAYLTSGTIRMAFLTGAIDGEDAEGPVGDFSIPKFSRNEPLEEGVSVPVTAKLAVFDKWLEPPIVADQTFSVSETALDLDVVDTVVATKGDDMASETLVYAITTQSTAGVFAIDSSDGEITVDDKTDLGSEGDVHTLTVKISYATSGLPYATATITINVTA